MANFRTHPRGNRSFDDSDLGVEYDEMKSLAHAQNSRKFLQMLTGCEKAVESNVGLTEWEEKFVGDLRDYFDSREIALDLGQTPWNPSLNQWNTLHGIWSKL